MQRYGFAHNRYFYLFFFLAFYCIWNRKKQQHSHSKRMKYTNEFWCYLIIDRIWSFCFALFLSTACQCACFTLLSFISQLSKYINTTIFIVDVHIVVCIGVFLCLCPLICRSLCMRAYNMIVLWIKFRLYMCAWKRIYERKYIQPSLYSIQYRHT